jgi:hypothetical protein
VKKRDEPTEEDLIEDIAAAYELVERLKRERSARARRTRAEFDRINREIAQALARKPR